MNEEEMSKEENFEHEVIDRLKNLEPTDFDYNTLDASYVDALLKARNIILKSHEEQRITINNLAEAVKFLATNPDLDKEEIIELFSNPEYQEYFNKLNKEE